MSKPLAPLDEVPPPLPPVARLHVWQIQAVRDVLVVLAVIAIIWAGYAMRSVTVPLLVALLLAYLFEPLVSSLVRQMRVSRPFVVAGLLLSVGAGVLILLALIVPLVIGQTVRFVQDVRAGRFQSTVLKLKEYVPQDHQADFERAIRWLMPTEDGQDHPQMSQIPQSGEPAVDSAPVDSQAAVAPTEEQRLRQLVREEIAAQAASTETTAQAGTIWDFIRASAGKIFGVIGAIVELGLLAFLIPFYFYFFSVSFPAVVSYGHDMIPVAQRPRAVELITKMDRAIAGFVRGRIVICLIMGVMLAIGWWIVGVPYSIVLGMVVGAFCLVPYLGGIGVPLAIGLLAFQQMHLPGEERMAWWGIILWPSVVFAIVQLFENYLLTPMIAGKATNLDPVTILVAVLAGGSVGGMYGMILAIPVAACLKILFTDVLLPRIRAWIRGEAQDPLPIGTDSLIR